MRARLSGGVIVLKQAFVGDNGEPEGGLDEGFSSKDMIVR
jgi:hypothetical protein